MNIEKLVKYFKSSKELIKRLHELQNLTRELEELGNLVEKLREELEAELKSLEEHNDNS